MCLKYGFENKVYILNQNTHDILFQIVIKKYDWEIKWINCPVYTEQA